MGEFLEWLMGESGWTICEHKKEPNIMGGLYYPVPTNINKILAKYHGIDLQRLEEEKLHMIKQLP